MENSRITSPGWLLKQDNMALINQCRKYIQMEFGTRLLFSQADLIERIREYSRHSQNHKLTELVQDLENRLSAHQEQTSNRDYRGRAPSAVNEASGVPANESPRSLRIYRGQIVSDS